ncbi:hypothetical protein ADUPG1_003752, partial [Aduncisulcus paluster]
MGFQESEISDYVIGYQKVIDSVTTSVEKPTDKQLRKLFLAGIKNGSFRVRVQTGLSVIEEPTFTDVIRVVYEEASTVEEDIKDLAPYLEKPRTKSSKGPLRGRYCGKLGHLEKDCWKKHPALKKSKSAPKQESTGEKKQVKCFKCGEIGHYANKCPLKAVKKEGELKVIESTSTDMAVHRRISLQADKGSSKIELQALVDSGASHSVISANVVEDLGKVQKYPCE